MELYGVLAVLSALGLNRVLAVLSAMELKAKTVGRRYIRVTNIQYLNCHPFFRQMYHSLGPIGGT